MDFAKTAFLIASTLFITWWMSKVYNAEGEERYVEACRPITVSTTYLMKVTSALTGFVPEWTVHVKRTLDGGCLYFFASFMFNDGLGEGTEQSVIQESRQGGITVRQ